MKRQALPKSVRFEVFKRDHFTCQYCGAKAPDAVLECDHVHPVFHDGQNVLENLRTACRDCNAGKGARLLGDRSRIQCQLEMMLDGDGRARWRAASPSTRWSARQSKRATGRDSKD